MQYDTITKEIWKNFGKFKQKSRREMCMKQELWNQIQCKDLLKEASNGKEVVWVNGDLETAKTLCQKSIFP